MSLPRHVVTTHADTARRVASFCDVFPRCGVRLPAVSQVLLSIITSGCCPLVRVDTATRPRRVQSVAFSHGKGERHIL
nr:MAG TPA: hypothetical protein [Caudoviricetes sp.]